MGEFSHERTTNISEPQPAQLDRFALIVPDELLHFPANVSPSAIGKERNEGKSLPPWRFGRLPADRTFTRGGVDSRVVREEELSTLTAVPTTPRLTNARPLSTETDRLDSGFPPLRSDLLCFQFPRGKMWMRVEL
ncbi:hypothetical protein JZ751_006998 [Albula glossodonta]|uniref:Uncharacterized protein n=1 Tax=Albula glossodonta TaxID=121402 RepID=A0A8T2P4Q0_9TELE|nr:hypothetical protein JZ751_006998 [Albula glossodonta]